MPVFRRNTQGRGSSIFIETIDIYGGAIVRVLASHPLYRIDHPCFDVSPEINLNHKQPQSSLIDNT